MTTSNRIRSTSFNSETGRIAGKKGGKISKKRPLDIEWREKLQTALKDSNKSTLDAIYNILLREATAGNMKAIDTLLDRAYGKAKQITEMSGIDGNPIDMQNRVVIKFE